MTNKHVLLSVLCAGALLPTAGHAAPVSLHVKPGLWEMTWSGQSSGAPPIPENVLAHMTPQQRARFQAAMAASMAKADATHTKKQCITEQNLQRGFDVKENRGSANCHQTVVSSTGSVMDVREECIGRQKISGTFHFEATGPEAMHGMINMMISEGGHTMTIKRALQARWLGASCGNVKAMDN